MNCGVHMAESLLTELVFTFLVTCLLVVILCPAFVS